MRILLINDFVQSGGTEVQHWREFDLLHKRGHDVYSLTFDPSQPIKTVGHRRNLHLGNRTFVDKFIHWLCLPHFKVLIKKTVDDIDPEVIHVNRVAFEPLSVFAAIAEYPAVQTIRDYGAVCPKGTCVLNDFSECAGFKCEDCSVCKCSPKDSIKLFYQNKLTSRRIASIDKFICPSEALSLKCSQNGIPTQALNNPFDFSKTDMLKVAEQPKTAPKKFLFYSSSISRIKGVPQLLEAFEIFSGDKDDVSLSFCGPVDERYSTEFFDRIGANSRYGYLGKLDNADILEVVSQAYCIVVPSLWLENYPNTVLESLAAGILVIGSNRGGIPELIRNKDQLFNILDIDSIVSCLNWAYMLKSCEREEICAAGREFVRVNNSLDLFGDKLEALLIELARTEHE